MRVATSKPRRPTDAGFTLIELLIVIVILGVIAFPLGNAVIGFLRNSAATSGRLVESHDAQLTAAYWEQDVASVGARDNTDPLDPQLKQSVEVGVGSGSGLYPCGTATAIAIVRFASDNVVVDATGVATTKVVVAAYVAEQIAGSTRFELRRWLCNGVSSPAYITVAHNLVAAPTVICDGGGSCTDDKTDVPKLITLTMNLQDTHSSSAYTVTLSGQRRQT